jgi:hypothetical protein
MITTTKKATLNKRISCQLRKNGQKATKVPTVICTNFRVNSEVVSFCLRHHNSPTTSKRKTTKTVATILMLLIVQQLLKN